MKLMQAVYMAFLIALVDYLGGCVSTPSLKEGKPLYEEKQAERQKVKKEFHQLVEVAIPLSNDGELGADVYRPIKKLEPKTLVILVPGSGNVSRKGEVTGDGVTNYDEALLMNHMWASALAEHGLFVLTYDKRTCTKSINAICRTNDQKDLEADGILGLARDLDQTLHYVRGKLNAHHARIVLMSTTQGAQTIALSQSLKDASGVILLSPIVTDLESMWTNGLALAAKSASPQQKMRLMNQRESMVSFFKSLKAGHFPEESIIRGASVTFWRSWIDASNRTVKALQEFHKPSLLLFSGQDSFSGSDVVSALKKQMSREKKVSIKTLNEIDRNFIDKNGVSPEALKAVLAFIDQMPAES